MAIALNTKVERSMDSELQVLLALDFLLLAVVQLNSAFLNYIRHATEGMLLFMWGDIPPTVITMFCSIDKSNIIWSPT